jgi:antagonist of KipI
VEAFKVLFPGPYTTVQDRGRFGYQQFGVPVTGALDPFAYDVANMLVGNPEDAAVLEATVMGPRFEVLAETDVAVTGGEAVITVNNQGAESWCSFRVKPGDVVNIGQVKKGCRIYLGLTGGIDVPVVMGSRSCYVGAKIGGYEGRILAKEDILKRAVGKLLASPRQVPKSLIPVYSSEVYLRAVPGPQDDFFSREGLGTFFGAQFTVSTNANRMGYRLAGPKVARKEGVPESIISEPSLPGGVQIPPDGQAILLLVEQTVGGYTKIATVISPDITRVAQAKPGDQIRFESVTLQAAHEAFREQQVAMKHIRERLAADRP